MVTLCNLLFPGIDLVGMLTPCDGKRYIATAICYFTKFVEARDIPEKKLALKLQSTFMKYFVDMRFLRL